MISSSFDFSACGKVFCGECSEFRIPLPQEQIFAPARVCKTCFAKHTQQINNDGTLTANGNGIGNGISSKSGKPELTSTVPCNNNSSSDNSQYQISGLANTKTRKYVKQNGVELH